MRVVGACADLLELLGIVGGRLLRFVTCDMEEKARFGTQALCVSTTCSINCEYINTQLRMMEN